PGVQLGGRRAAAVPHAGAVVHRLPAAVGPAVHLGGHRGDVAGRVRARDRQAVAVPAAGRDQRGAEHALTLVRAARAGVAVRAGHLPGRPLLADPQGRRNLGTAVGGCEWREKNYRRTRRRSTGSWPRSWARGRTGGWPRAGPAPPPCGRTGPRTGSPRRRP